MRTERLGAWMGVSVALRRKIPKVPSRHLGDWACSYPTNISWRVEVLLSRYSCKTLDRCSSS